MIDPQPLRPLFKDLVVLKARRVGRTAAMWQFRRTWLKLHLDVMGALCEEVQFEWPGVLLSTNVEEFVPIGGFVMGTREPNQYRRIGGRGRHLRFEALR